MFVEQDNITGQQSSLEPAVDVTLIFIYILSIFKVGLFDFELIIFL